MKKIIVFVLLALIFSCKKKTTPTPTGNITFWSDDNYCGSIANARIIYVSLDGVSVGQISNFQSIPPSSCVQSNVFLVVSTTQGSHTLTFTDNCCPTCTYRWSATATINLTSDCYVYYAPHR